MSRWVLISFVLLAQAAHAQAIPRTPDGKPDFQGVWENNFGTPLERPANASGLAVGEAEATRLYDEGVKARPDMSFNYGVQPSQFLIRLRGEYRSSLVVQPETGRLPYTPFALDILSGSIRSGFDGHDQRPPAERCMGGAGLAPMLPATENNLRRIVQTRDHLVIHTEQYGDARIIPLARPMIANNPQSDMGQSVARWEGATLIVETTHLRADRPVRAVHAVAGSRLAVGAGSRVIERFTLIGRDELHYDFTVEDRELYSAPWRAEYVMRRSQERPFEFACHEGNYALANILSGARIAEQRAAARKITP